MKTTAKIIVAILLACGLQSCTINAIKTTKGNGDIVKREFTISDYHTINFSGGASLVYEQNKEAAPYLRIETDENILSLLIVDSKSNTLSINNEGNIKPTRYAIFTNSTGLNELRISGSLQAHLKGNLSTDRLSIRLSGSGNVLADHIECREIEASIAGSAGIKLAGKAKEVHGRISGSGDIHTLSMEADRVFCKVSGSGHFSVHAAEYLNISVSGSGEIRYTGNPQIEQSISGSGHIKRIN